MKTGGPREETFYLSWYVCLWTALIGTLWTNLKRLRRLLALSPEIHRIRVYRSNCCLFAYTNGSAWLIFLCLKVNKLFKQNIFFKLKTTGRTVYLAYQTVAFSASGVTLLSLIHHQKNSPQFYCFTKRTDFIKDLISLMIAKYSSSDAPFQKKLVENRLI